MAPATGFWRFMDDVHEMMFPMASLNWQKTKTPLKKPVVPTANSDPAQPVQVPGLDPAAISTLESIHKLNNQNKELLQEKTNAIKWQDAASMAIKEAKDEAEISKQEAKAAKKAGLLAAAKIQKQLDDSRTQVSALKNSNRRAGVEKNVADAEHRNEISLAEGRIEELQKMLLSAISHGRESIEAFEELFLLSQNMHNELVAKDQKMVAKEREKKALQDRLDARSSTFKDISENAKKSREACDRMYKEKVKAEKAQKAAECTVGDLQLEASRVKATTDRATKSLETELAEAEARVTRADARSTKAKGDVEQLRTELDNTETARQNFEKREGELAARFDEFPIHAAGSSSQSMEATTTVPESEQSTHFPTTTAGEVQVLSATKDASKENNTEEWKRNVRREIEGQNQTVLATERGKLQQELNNKYQKALAAERESIYKKILGELKIKFDKELAKRKTDWETQHEHKKSQIETKIRAQFQTDLENSLANHKTQLETEYDAAERPRLETQIRAEVQAEFQNALADQKTQLQVEFVDQERPQLESKIRAQVQDDYQDELSKFKNEWEADHSLPEAGPSSQRIADSGNPIEVDEPENVASPTAVASDNNLVLDSLSRESDETHLLMQEIAAAGIAPGPGANTVLQELNAAKDALYEVKCELRKSDTVANKNTLLHAVRGFLINEHYIGKLSTKSRKVLIRQASEANERLGYLNRILGTNADVPKDATLRYLLEPLKSEDENMTETEHVDGPEYPQISNDFGTSNFAQTINNARYSAGPSTSPFSSVNGPASSSPFLSTPKRFGDMANSSTSNMPDYPQIANNGFGSSKFSQMINNARYSTVPSSSAFTTINGPASSAAPGTSPYLPSSKRFGSTATSSPSAPKYTPSPLPGLQALNGFGAPTVPKSSPLPGLEYLNGFGAPAVPMVYQTPTKGVYNPFEASHFGNQPSLDSTPTLSKNNNGSSASDAFTETKNHPNRKFKKTFGPILPQGEGPAPPVDATSNKDHDMNTGDTQPSLPVTPDPGSVAGVGSVPAPPRKKKLVQGLRPKFAPKSRQAFGKKQDASSSVPAGQTPQGNPEAHVPTTEAGSSRVPKTAFTLEPNHAFGM